MKFFETGKDVKCVPGKVFLDFEWLFKVQLQVRMLSKCFFFFFNWSWNLERENIYIRIFVRMKELELVAKLVV